MIETQDREIVCEKDIADELMPAGIKTIEEDLILRKKIAVLENEISRSGFNLGEDPFPLKHTFTDGVYAREITMPKGILIIGKIHRHEHLNFLLKGDVSVLTEEGPRRIKAPCMMVSPAGTKRVVYTHEETVWTTVHVTNERDLTKIEELTIAKTYADIGRTDPIIGENEEALLVPILEMLSLKEG